jgi:hypothetical protein
MRLSSNATDAENNGSAGGAIPQFSSFNNDGFSLSTSNENTNSSSYNYVAWNWDMGADTPTGFGCVTYTGNGGAQYIGGTGFQPDLVWLKTRSTTTEHTIYDAIRGTTKQLSSVSTAVENTQLNMIQSFDADGFSIGTDNAISGTDRLFVAWNWKANGSGSANTVGDIDSTVSANTDAGFSIVSYTGTGSTATVGHGLSKAPNLTIIKPRNFADNWIVTYDSVDGSDDQAYLNLTNAGGSPSASYAVAQNATTLGLTDWNNVNDTDDTYIAYCFHSVDSYSKCGSYNGNDNADGTFVYTGFRPAYVMVKRTENSDHWFIWDTKRDTYNVMDTTLKANGSDAEGTDIAYYLDSTSNGFKLRTTFSALNSAETYIYIAFAETPFKYSNAR